MQLNPSLIFNGRAEEALQLYRDALGGNIEITRYAESPMANDICEEFKDKVLYGALRSPLGVVAAMDCSPEQGGQPGSNFSITLNVESEAQADTTFGKLADGGEITMPLGKTFWAERFGMLKYKFGISWMVNYAKN